MQRLHLSGAIGCPAAYLFVLLRHKDRVKNPRGPDAASRLQNRAVDPVLKPFKFLFAAYRPEMWWYEVVETVRRLTMTGLLVLVSDPDVRLSVAICLAFGSVLLHTTTQPYTDPATNILAHVSHLLVFVMFFVGQQISIEILDTENLAVGVVLVIILITLPVLIVRSQLTQASRDRIEDLRRHERDVQAEEMFATLDELKAKEDEFCARTKAPESHFRRFRRQQLEARPPPAPPPPSLKISECEVNFVKCSFPCYVMNLRNLCELDELPVHEDAYQAGLLEILTLTSEAFSRHHRCIREL